MARDLKAQSIRLAEKITDHLDGLPWPMVVFLKLGQDGSSPSVYYFKPNDPEMDRFSRKSLVFEVGTYTRHCSANDVAEDVYEVLKARG